MKRTIAIGLALSLAGLSVASCTSGVDEAVLAALGGDCLLDSDCEDALACVFEQCHERCSTSADCSNGARCVVGTPTVHVCELDPSATCAKNTDCPGAMVCGPDAACRDACITSADCLADQLCTRDRVCALPSELDGGALPHTLDGGGCLVSSDCDAPEQCFDGVCRLECESAADCVSGVCEANVCAPPIPGGPACIPGHQQTCACDGGGAGVEICEPDGLTYGECLGCGPPGKLGCYTPTNPDPDIGYAAGFTTGATSALAGAAMTDDGSVIVGGGFDTMVLDGAPAVATGTLDALLFQLAPDGSFDWIWSYGQPGAAISIDTIARATNGDILATGLYSATTPNFGNGPLPAGPGMFVIRFDPNGVPLASVGFAGAFGTGLRAAIAASPDDGVVVAGDLSAPADLGGGVLGTGFMATSFVLKLDASLSHVFSRGWGNASYTQDSTPNLAFTAAGDVIVVGSFRGSVDFGLGTTSNMAPARTYVAKYSASGAPVFAQVFDGTALNASTNAGVYASGNGELHIGGVHYDGIDFGNGPLAGIGAFDLTLDANGVLVDATSLEGLFVSSYASDSNGGSIVGGFAQSTTAFDVGTCTIDSQGYPWPMVYHRLADGSVDWVRAYEVTSTTLAVPRRLPSNAAGQTAVLLAFAGLNMPFAVDIGGAAVNGRYAVFSIDP